MPLRMPKDRLALAFWALIVGLFVSTAVFAWQAVESQEVKGSLKGGFTEPVAVAGAEGETVNITTLYTNEGDQTITLEGAELVEPTQNLELVGVEARQPGGSASLELEGFKVEPAEPIEVVVFVEIGPGTGAIASAPPGERAAAFDGLRLHYRAGGRAGQTG